MLSRLMIEQGDLLLTQLQYKTTLKYIVSRIPPDTAIHEQMDT